MSDGDDAERDGTAQRPLQRASDAFQRVRAGPAGLPAPGVVALALLVLLAGCTGAAPEGSLGDLRTAVVVGGAGSAGPPATPPGEYTPFPTATPAATGGADAAEAGTVDNPWGERRIVVAVGRNAAPYRAFEEAVRRAIAYWEANDERAAYPFDFVLAPNASDPDVVVNYVTSVNCEGHGEAAGCAPVLTADSDAPDPVVVDVEASLQTGLRSDTVTTIHELGHVLGLGHCDEPTWVMANGCETVADRPNATERGFPFRDGTVSVYVDYGNVSAENLSGTRRQVRAVLSFYAGGANGTVPANVTFRRVEDPYAADVVVSWKPGGVGDSFGAWSTTGQDLDGDGAVEYYTRGAVAIDTVPVHQRGYFLGWLLGRVLTPDGLPPEFAGGVEDVPWADDRRGLRPGPDSSTGRSAPP